MSISLWRVESCLKQVVCDGIMSTLCFQLHPSATITKCKHEVHYDGLSSQASLSDFYTAQTLMEISHIRTKNKVKFGIFWEVVGSNVSVKMLFTVETNTCMESPEKSDFYCSFRLMLSSAGNPKLVGKVCRMTTKQ